MKLFYLLVNCRTASTSILINTSIPYNIKPVDCFRQSTCDFFTLFNQVEFLLWFHGSFVTKKASQLHPAPQMHQLSVSSVEKFWNWRCVWCEKSSAVNQSMPTIRPNSNHTLPLPRRLLSKICVRIKMFPLILWSKSLEEIATSLQRHFSSHIFVRVC